MTTTTPAAGLGGIFAIAFGIFGAVMLVLVAPHNSFDFTGYQTWNGVWSVLAVFGVLFLGNAANQRLNVLLFKRELPVGIFTLVALPTLFLLAAASR